MNGLFDAFWRAAAYCLHPRVILWSVAPVLLAGALVGGLAWWQGETTVQIVRAWLEGWPWTQTAMAWLGAIGTGRLREWVAPLIVLALAVPLLVVLSLLLVALLMMPAIVSLVASRRFPQMERREGAAWWQVGAWSLVSSLLALVVLALSVPLWLLPPLALVLPPLIWGWLTYRVFAYEVLAGHADADERRRILSEHRMPLLAMGIIAGYMGAVPTLIWAFGAVTLVLAPLLLVVSVWLYTLIFAFAAAWFAHYALAALQAMRMADPGPIPAPPTAPALAHDVVIDVEDLRPPSDPRPPGPTPS